MKALKTYKILAVDDQPENLKVIVSIAQRFGPEYEILQEVDANLALEIALEERPDLIITDWEMPTMDGIEFIKRLRMRAATREIPVIMCTGIMTSSENLQTALDAGAVDYIRKPIDPVEFTARVRSIMQLAESFQTIRQQVTLLEKQKAEIADEREKSEALLLNILPQETAEELKAEGRAKSRHYEQVSVLFTDFQGFTKVSEQLAPEDLVEEVHYYYSKFDEIISQYGIEKIKTIGDAYMCAGGLPVVNTTNALDVVNAALHIQAFMALRKAECEEQNKPYFELRLGIHTGPVVAGIVGIKKFAYDIWGDTVNTAARMESAGEVERVNISEATYLLIRDHFKCSYRGKIAAKNKGEISMYFVDEVLPVGR